MARNLYFILLIFFIQWLVWFFESYVYRKTSDIITQIRFKPNVVIGGDRLNEE